MWAISRQKFCGRPIKPPSELRSSKSHPKGKKADIDILEKYAFLRAQHKSYPTGIATRHSQTRTEPSPHSSSWETVTVEWSKVLFSERQTRHNVSQQAHPQDTLPRIRTHNQITTADPTKILSAFREFYHKLYSDNQKGSDSSISQFLDTLPIPELSEKHKSIMEDWISVEETLEVIKNLKRGSAPGPDGSLL